MRINKGTRPVDVESLAGVAPYLMYRVRMGGSPAEEVSLARMCADQPTWDVQSMVGGMRRLVDLTSRGRVLHDVYAAGELSADPRKAEVKLIHMVPDAPDLSKPFVIGLAGGAYACVCSLVESIPVAARLNELGYQVFILNYRCGESPVLPRALDDVAAAVRFVLAHKGEFGVESDEYVVNGFSAGANLSSLWGTEAVGWAHYGLPAPKALWLMYPLVSYDVMPEGPMTDHVRDLIYGAGASRELVYAYDTARLVNEKYPPCFVAHAKDDPVVSVRNTELLRDLLAKHGVPAQVELIEKGGHGWGDGTGTDATGWPDRADAWLGSQRGQSPLATA